MLANKCIPFIPFVANYELLLMPKCYKYMCGIYLCALCESLLDHIIKLHTNLTVQN